MSAIRRVFAWFGGRALLYGALVVAILAGAYVTPWLKSEWSEPARHLDLAERFETMKAQLEAGREATQQRLSVAAAEAQRKSLAELDLALADARRAKADAEAQRRGPSAKAVSLLRADSDALLNDGQVELEIQYRDGEIAGLSSARERLMKRDALAALPTDIEPRLGQAAAAALVARNGCRSSRLALETFEARWPVRATLQLYDARRHAELEAANKDLCRKSTEADGEQLRLVALKQRQDAALQAYQQARAWTDVQVQSVTRELDAQIAKERDAANGSWRRKLSLWAERVHLSTVLKQAALSLVLILAAPYLIRLLCFFVLAPMAMRRPPIRVCGPEGTATTIPPAERSTTSVGVKLAAGEELLVRNGYLQTTSEAGGKSTQWLLDPRHPITSIATGLTFLTRIRGEGEVTTVSAVRDPFAEVSVMTVPLGAACVLQPRALAAVVQPIGRRLRVTGHWRLLSLNAWLTLQLRFLVFHGPARLVLQGGRGVRVERAERGRILGQDQVIGFSTDLAYSVTRSETFWPYFLGREPLLKDRVAAGDGVLIVEEAPRASRRPGEVRHGIEGLIDAGMKAFGM